MVYHLDKMETKEFFPGFNGKMIHGEKCTMAYWHIKKGASIHLHDHAHEQVVNMMEGVFELIMDGTSYILHPGDVLVIPSNVSHEGAAITDCRILDVFTPVREEYR